MTRKPPSSIVVRGHTGRVELFGKHGAGRVALVSVEDVATVAPYRWRVMRDARNEYVVTSKAGKVLLMHRLILDPPEDLVVDHISGDGLDNQRGNMRVVSHRQNAQNQGSNGGSSFYKGVSWNKGQRVWQAHIRINGKLKSLGAFEIEEEAAIAYDEAAREHFGVTRYNFPRPGELRAWMFRSELDEDAA